MPPQASGISPAGWLAPPTNAAGEEAPEPGREDGRACACACLCESVSPGLCFPGVLITVGEEIVQACSAWPE